VEDEQRRQRIRAILVQLLNAAFTEPELGTLCAEQLADGYATLRTGANKLDKIVLLIDHCASHPGLIDLLLQQIEHAEPRQYDRFAHRLAPLLPWPEMTAASIGQPSLTSSLVRLQLVLSESDNRKPPPNTSVYAWLRVDDEDFDIIGNDVCRIPWAGATPEPVTFNLRPRRTGHQRVRIELTHESTYLGAVEEDIRVPPPGEPTAPTPITATVTLTPDLTPPDLLIRFYRADVREGRVYYHYRVSSPLPELQLALEHLGGVALDEPATVLRTVLEDLDRWANLETPAKQDLDARLAALGVNLYAQLVGRTGLADLYWRLPRRCRTVQIISDVPGIPWEMMRPKDQAGPVDEPWARQFHLTRWHPEAGAAAPGFQLDAVKLFVGQSVRPLPGAEPEAQALETLLGARCGRVPPDQLRNALAAGGFGALHIISHGYGQSDNADESYVEVGGGEPKLAASDLSVYNWRVTQPLLFVNACNVGREGVGLTGLGGWATIALTRAHAGAFIGALWQATDGTAGLFSRAFYERILSGATIGEAAHSARLAIAPRPDPTWACYAVYAHPNARMTS
jgi:hypothetical protein